MNLFIRDPKLNVKSVCVTFAVVSFILSICSIALSHKFLSCLPGSILSVLLFVLCMVFYRIRRVDELSLNLKSGEVEIKDSDK